MYTAYEDTYLKNTYMTCNSETYNQEVMEVFVAPHTNDSVRYHEVSNACLCVVVTAFPAWFTVDFARHSTVLLT
jgi:hypothetical protein